MSTTLTPAPTAPPASRTHATVEIEYWTVEMDSDSCSACDDTLTAVRSAQELLGTITDQLGLRVEIVERTVRTWDEAVEHSIAASPTIRSEGLELHPRHEGLSETRTWQWRGDTSPGPLAGQLVEFLLGAVAARGRRLEAYLQAGSAAPYLDQFLQPSSREEQATVSAEPADSCCG